MYYLLSHLLHSVGVRVGVIVVGVFDGWLAFPSLSNDDCGVDSVGGLLSKNSNTSTKAQIERNLTQPTHTLLYTLAPTKKATRRDEMIYMCLLLFSVVLFTLLITFSEEEESESANLTDLRFLYLLSLRM